MSLYLCLFKCGKKEPGESPAVLSGVCDGVGESTDEVRLCSYGCRTLSNKHRLFSARGETQITISRNHPCSSEEGTSVSCAKVWRAGGKIHGQLRFSWSFGFGEATKSEFCKAQLSKVVLGASPETPARAHLPVLVQG